MRIPHQQPIQVLFTGYAPVHFVCFQPLFLRLAQDPDFSVWVSGGLREVDEDEGYLYRTYALYKPFGIDPERMLTMDQIAERDFDLLFAANTKMLEPRSVRAKIQVFHGVSFRNRAIRKRNLSADYFFMAGPYMQRKWSEAGLLPPDDPRGVRTGFMKTDRLVDGSLKREELLSAYGFDGSRPVILYAPTGQKHNSLELMGEEFLQELKATGRFDVLVKLHDHPKDTSINWQARIAAIEDPHLRLVQSYDIIPAMFLSDLLVTDASSVSSEYALLDRPMVFLDVPQLIESAARKSSSMLDLKTWGRHTGIIAKTASEGVAAVEESLAQPERFAELRQAMAQDLFYNPGRATETAYQWVRRTFVQDRAETARASTA